MADKVKNSGKGNNKGNSNSGKGKTGQKSASGKKTASASRTKAKSEAAKTRTRAKEDKKAGNAAGSRLRDEITALVMIALGIFLVLSVLTKATGAFGEILSMVLKGCFGLMAYVLPFYLIVYGLLVLLNRMAHVNGRTVFFTLLMFLDMSMLDSARFAEVKSGSFGFEYIGMMFNQGYTLQSAGAVGMTLGWLAAKCVDIAGLVILGILIIVISVMMIVNTPISVFLENRRVKKAQKTLERERAAEEQMAMDLEEEEDAGNGGGVAAVALTGPSSDPSKAVIVSKPTDTKPESSRWGFGRGKGKKAADAAQAGDQRFLSDRGGNNGTDASKDYSQMDDNHFSASIQANQQQILNFMKDENLFSHDSLGRNDADKVPEDINFRLNVDNTSKAKVGGAATGVAAAAGGLAGGALAAGGQVAGTPADKKPTDFKPAESKLEATMPGESKPDEFKSAESKPETAKPVESKPDDTNFVATKPVETKPAEAKSAEAGSDFVRQAMEAAENSEDKKLTKAEAQAVVTQGAALVGQEIEQAASVKKEYVLPPLDLLRNVEKKKDYNEEAMLAEKAQRLEQVLQDFGVSARVIDVKKGPSVTRYEIQPATGVKVNSIVRLADDIALNLEARSLRIEAPIPGKAAVGIEVENDSSIVVSLREMIDCQEFREAKSNISFVVGENISGDHIVADLKGMPHMLIAGSTGSGKSVCINSIIMSMLYKSTPDQVKFILIDPKVVELGTYNGIPHMLIPVVTDPSKAAAALAWAVQEMNDRYNKFAELHVRDLASYNERMRRNGEEDKVLPQIVIIIDELADLMMVAAKQVEESICRLAQLARAAGMHLIVATQRPSVDVVTGLIKANIPSRIAFAVSSQVDSRTILDKAGAEKLVGKGDMLFHPLGKAQAERLQGPFVTDDEVTAVIEFWQAQAGDDNTAEEILKAINSSVKTEYVESEEDDEDDIFGDAVDLVLGTGQASASMLQRRFRIGYNRAGRLIDTMEARGIIGQSEGSKPRKVLVTKEEYYGYSDNDVEYIYSVEDVEASHQHMEAEPGDSSLIQEEDSNDYQPDLSQPTEGDTDALEAGTAEEDNENKDGSSDQLI